MESKSRRNLESIARFKSSVEKSYMNFRDVIKEFGKIEKEMDKCFDGEVIEVKKYISKQSKHSLL